VGFIGWIVLGLLAGIIAKVLMPGRDPGGCIITMLIGVVGALLGGFLSSRLLGIDRGGFFDLRTWIIAIVGSIILLLIYRLIAGRRTRR
jgi:uncharacterized membrane protein YeaQ/YmgE (transglycosylase-associated protein family)